jgi:hypothetical protein
MFSGGQTDNMKIAGDANTNGEFVTVAGSSKWNVKSQLIWH